MRYAFFLMLRAAPAWLNLPRPQRRALAELHLAPLLLASAGKLTMRYFDAEAFTATCSDVMLVETEDPARHYFFMEGLRDSPFFTVPYFELMKVIPTVEEGYKSYEDVTGP